MNPRGCRGTVASTESKGTNTIIGGMQVVAQQVDNVETGLAMILQELNQVLTSNDRQADIVQRLRSNLVRASRQTRAEAEYIPWVRHSEGQTSIRFRTHREPDSALAEHEYVARGMAFLKKGSSATRLRYGFDGIKSLQRIGGQIAEETIRPQRTIQAACWNCALHRPVIQPGAGHDSDYSHFPA